AWQLQMELQQELTKEMMQNVNNLNPDDLKKAFALAGKLPKFAPPLDGKAAILHHLGNLNSGNEFLRAMALHHFRTIDPNCPDRGRVPAALERDAPEKPNSQTEVGVLGRWATPAQVPVLLQIANTGKNMFGHRHGSVLKTLAELKDDRALPILVDSLSDGGFD